MQPREKLVLEFWDRSKELHINNNEYGDFANEFFSLLLKSDIKKGDLTSNFLIKKNRNISAYIAAKETGILAGLEEFNFLNRGLKIRQLKNDGDRIKSGEILLKLTGNAVKILERERTNLNLLQRMSGIATLTYNLNKKLNNKIRVAATRKNLWGLLDKKAVSIGGGLTHRLNLGDGIIIKDNHLKIIGYDFKKAINSVKNSSIYIEIEVENAEQALEAALIIRKSKGSNKNVHAVMLDKINPKEIKLIIQELKIRNLYEYVLLEASGNITPENLHEYSDCGVDIISMGCITNSAKALNMSMEIE
ncbi:carboxylating nicotinate-nucleotide diphosphorylase [Candidatus Woesearchaeota archaeon]|nr:carboxylating nicotinate-nucleotide diphosphorylase [Candidatus Woesearchaeota archaeon]